MRAWREDADRRVIAGFAEKPIVQSIFLDAKRGKDGMGGAVEEFFITGNVEGAGIGRAGGVPGVDSGRGASVEEADALAGADGFPMFLQLPRGAGGGGRGFVRVQFPTERL